MNGYFFWINSFLLSLGMNVVIIIMKKRERGREEGMTKYHFLFCFCSFKKLLHKEENNVASTWQKKRCFMNTTQYTINYIITSRGNFCMGLIKKRWEGCEQENILFKKGKGKGGRWLWSKRYKMKKMSYGEKGGGQMKSDIITSKIRSHVRRGVCCSNKSNNKMTPNPTMYG